MAHATVKPGSSLRQNMWAIFTNVACPLISVLTNASAYALSELLAPKTFQSLYRPIGHQQDCGIISLQEDCNYEVWYNFTLRCLQGKGARANNCPCFKIVGVSLQVHRPMQYTA